MTSKEKSENSILCQLSVEKSLGFSHVLFVIMVITAGEMRVRCIFALGENLDLMDQESFFVQFFLRSRLSWP